MMKLDFGDVLGRMRKIGWNHKVLWLWQMLPALTAIVFVPLFFISNPFFMRSSPEHFSGIASKPWTSTAFGLVNLFAVIPSIFLAVIIQLTTTCGAVKIEKGAEKLAFVELFRESLPYFWRVLGLYFLLGGALMLIWFGFILLFTFIFMASAMFTFTLGLVCIIPFFLLLIPVLLIGYSIGELAQAAIVADNMGTLESISHGWKLFRANWLSVTLLMLLLYVMMYILSSIFAFPAIFPMMIFMRELDLPSNANTSMSIVFFVAFPLLFMLVYAIQGILMAFFQSAWAVTYLRLTQQKEEAPVIIGANA